MYSFDTRTGCVLIDHDRCQECASKACVEACKHYGAVILKLVEGKPLLNLPSEEARRRDPECVACELACWLRGRRAITILLPIEGLEQFRSGVDGDTAG